MERNLKVERLYFLGDYKNIKFANELLNIPDEVATNVRLTELLFTSQFIACEIAYRNYVNMLEEMNEKYGMVRDGKKVVDPEAVLEFLNEQRTKNLQDILAEIDGLTAKKQLTTEKETE